MIKFWFVATMVLAMTTGVAVAQNSGSVTTTTLTTTADPAPMYGSASSSSRQQNSTTDGVVTDKTQTYSSGTTVTPNGDMATTRRTIETANVR